MNKTKTAIFLLSALFFYSCSSTKTTFKSINSLLSKEKGYSTTSNISVNIPSGWFVAEDNECNCTDLWLVKNDYSSSIIFRKINVDANAIDNSPDQLGKLIYYSKVFVKSKFGKTLPQFENESNFELTGKQFSSYSYENPEGQIIRTVIFKHHGNFFESEAISDKNDPDEIVTIHNAVLTSLN